jgi:hypothetical protein
MKPPKKGNVAFASIVCRPGTDLPGPARGAPVEDEQ